MHAARNGHTETAVALVLDFGACVDRATPVEGRTALMYAASHGYTGTALSLVMQCGADERRRDARGLTAAMYAAGGGFLDTAQALGTLSERCPNLISETDEDNSKPAASSSGQLADVHSSHKRKQAPGNYSAKLSQYELSNAKVSNARQAASPSNKRSSTGGVRVISSHLPRKASAPPNSGNLSSGACAQEGGLWTIQETAEVGAE